MIKKRKKRYFRATEESNLNLERVAWSNNAQYVDDTIDTDIEFQM